MARARPEHALLPLLQELRGCSSHAVARTRLEEDLFRHLRRFDRMITRIMDDQPVNVDDVLRATARQIADNSSLCRARTEAQAVSYCRTSVRNYTISLRRKERPVRDRPSPNDPNHTIAGLQASDRASNPERAASRSQLRNLLDDALGTLTHSEREIVLRVCVTEERVRDLAKELNVPENTLTKRKNRALAKLAAILPADLLSLYRDGEDDISWVGGGKTRKGSK